MPMATRDTLNTKLEARLTSLHPRGWAFYKREASPPPAKRRWLASLRCPPSRGVWSRTRSCRLPAQELLDGGLPLRSYFTLRGASEENKLSLLKTKVLAPEIEILLMDQL